jgi:RNA polymerase sigma-70 factor, ECF subfamily
VGPEESELLDALRRGDEDAFGRLVNEHHASLRRVARLYVANAATADEVVQETWLGVIRGIWAFEGRSSLKTWIFRILVNRARTRALRESRRARVTDTFSTEGDTGVEPSASPERVLVAGAEPLDQGARREAPDRCRRHPTEPEGRSVAPRCRGMVGGGGV